MCQYSSADQEITYQLPQILANYLQKIMSIQIDSSTSQSPPLHTIMSKKAMGRSSSFYRQCQFFGSKPCSAYLKSSLFDFFFQSEQYFSFTTFQPEQYFSATFSQVSASRTGPGHHSIVYSFFFFIRICIKVSSFVASPHPKSQGK